LSGCLVLSPHGRRARNCQSKDRWFINDRRNPTLPWRLTQAAQ
jgi:hypothetical protein